MADLKTNVERIREARGLSEAELSARLAMSQEVLRSLLESPPVRKETFIRNLSRELLVPEVFLFADELDFPEIRLVDFRQPNPTPRSYSRQTLQAIDFAWSIARASATQDIDDNSTRLSAVIGEGATTSQAAKRLRRFLGLTPDVQTGFVNSREMFAFIRQRIERLNIFVLQLSFPDSDGTGFSISGDPYNVIILNTAKQSHARRLFTLAHELCHCASGQSGLSDSRLANNAIERRCNRFAGKFLAPRSLVNDIAADIITSPELDIERLKQVANALNISMYATLIRLVEVGIYDAKVIPQWKRYIADAADPDSSVAGGGRRVEEWKYKLSRYGYKFASVFGSAKRRGDFDDLEFYQFSGIKPKYQTDYLERGMLGRPEDADVDEG